MSQPKPTPNGCPAVWDLIRADIWGRDWTGVGTYGVRLQPFNGRDALLDAYEEALDMAAYLRLALYERSDMATMMTTPESLANGAAIKAGTPSAEPVPPTALPADVYLDKLERLLMENAALKSMLGECLGLCRNISGMIDSGYDWGGSDWYNEAVGPLVDRLKTAMGVPRG